MIIDTLNNSKRYECLHPFFKIAFDFLQCPTRVDTPIGRLELDGTRLFAMIQTYETKPVELGKLEAHRRYIDIQFMLEGEEYIGYAPLNNQTPVNNFDIDKDIGFYEGESCLVYLRKNMFAIFFPEDAHLPGRYIKNPSSVKKIIIKIAISI